MSTEILAGSRLTWEQKIQLLQEVGHIKLRMVDVGLWRASPDFELSVKEDSSFFLRTIFEDGITPEDAVNNLWDKLWGAILVPFGPRRYYRWNLNRWISSENREEVC